MPESIEIFIIVALGGVAAIYASWQMIKKGLILWILLLLLGLAAIQIGLSRPQDSLEDLVKRIEVADVTDASLESLSKACQQVEKLKQK